MKKTILIITIISAIIMGLIISERTRKQKSSAFTVGILQTATHPALDAVRDGFIEELKKRMGDRIAFVIQNAQGSIADAHAIAQQFHAKKSFNGFFAIATPAAQALSAVEKDRPICIAAVTDPTALGFDESTGNVSGATDMINIEEQIATIVQLTPNIRTIGLLFTSGETNSLAMVKRMQAIIKSHGLTPIDCAISNEADVAAITQLACRKADLLLAPTDNTVACTINLIASIAQQHNKPLIVSDVMLVERGALAGCGIDYHASGKQVARIAHTLLTNDELNKMSIEQPEENTVVVNKKVLEQLGLTIPHTLRNKITLI